MKTFILSIGAFVVLLALASLAIVSVVAVNAWQWLRERRRGLIENPIRRLKR